MDTRLKRTGKHLTFPVPSLFGHIHPLGHEVHCSWLPQEYVPSSQLICVELLVNGQNFPTGQTVQNWSFPSEYDPKQKDNNVKLS